MSRLQERYDQVVHSELMKEFGYANALQVPRLDKIVVNMGVGEAVQDGKKIDAAVGDLTAITGQHPIMLRAKQSIATYKLRENMPIGGKVTLRRERMYEFLDRLVNIALPRVRDFRGVSARASTGAAITRSASRSSSCFRRSTTTSVDAVRGMDIIIVTTAQNRRRSQGLAEGLRHAVRQLTACGDTIPMAKKSSIEKNQRRAKMSKAIAPRRRPPQGARP